MTTKYIESASLYDFSLALQAAVLEGYRVDDATDNIPQRIGEMVFATLVKAEKDGVEVIAPNVPPTISTVAKQQMGRKKNG